MTPSALCQVQVLVDEGSQKHWSACGAGILIHSDWVLTAAHVSFEATEPQWLRVAIGDPPNQTFYPVQAQYAHPDYCADKQYPSYADMALLALSKSADGVSVQPFLKDWDWYQSRWKNHQLTLQFWGRPFQEGHPYLVENEKRLHNVCQAEYPDGVLSIQMATDDNTQLVVEGGIPNGFSGGPVITTLRGSNAACVGLTVQGGALFGKAATTSFALSTRLILPWLESFAKSHKIEKLYTVLEAKDANSFAVFNWRRNDDFKNLYDDDDISALLTWSTALSPLVGRQREEKEFNLWIERAIEQPFSGISVRVIYGEGGVGKTRFVCEWAEGLSQNGWQVIDASRMEFSELAKNIKLSPDSPWLVVFDYPEQKQNQFFEGLRALIEAKKADQPLLMALLSRSGENRWNSLFSEQHNANEVKVDYYPLYPIQPEDSYTLLTEVMERLDVNKQRVPREEYLDWLTKEAERTHNGRCYMEYPLLILGQAICLGKDTQLHFRQLTHHSVLEALVSLVWRKLSTLERAQEIRLDSAEHEISHRLHMLSILFGPITLEVLKHLSQEKSCDELGLPSSSRNISPMLGAKGLNLLNHKTLQPMTPDVFATAFAQSVYRKMSEEQQTQSIQWFAALLRQFDSDRLLEAFSIFELRYADSIFGLKSPIRDIYEQLLAAFRADALLQNSTFDCIPLSFDLLPELSSQVFICRVERYRALAEDDFISHASNLASELRELSINLNKAGDQILALQTIEESIQVHQELLSQLNETDPNYAEVMYDMGWAYNTLHIYLSDKGEYQESSEVLSQSIKIFRMLTNSHHSIRNIQALASALNNLSICMAQLGDREASTKAIEEAVELGNSLAQQDFIGNAHDLAGNLCTLSNRLADNGEPVKSLHAIEEAVAIMRKLIKHDFYKHLEPWLTYLNNLSNALSRTGNHQAAVAAISEALTTYRDLLPTNYSYWAPDYARALINLSHHLKAGGDRSECLKLLLVARAMYSELSKLNFNKYSSSLAVCLANISIELMDIRNLEGALSFQNEAISIYRELAEDNFSVYGESLARNLSNLSNLYSAIKDTENMLTSTKQSVDIYRALAEGDFSAYGPGLAFSLNNMSLQLGQTGDQNGALKAIQEAVEIRRVLVENFPEVYRSHLGNSLHNLALALSNQGDWEDGFKAAQEALAIRRSMFEENQQANASVYGESLCALFFTFKKMEVEILDEMHRIYQAIKNEVYLPWIKYYPFLLENTISTAGDDLCSELRKKINACINDLKSA